MGHCLGLYHTHYGTFEEARCVSDCQPATVFVGCQELVNGSNGDICGDYVQDTPADPLAFFTNINLDCTWNGVLPFYVDCSQNVGQLSATDLNGD